MNLIDAEIKLQKIGQEHLLNHWLTLDIDEKAILLDQIKKIDLEMFNDLKRVLKFEKNSAHTSLTPYNDYEMQGSEINKNSGLKLVSEGKVGCLIVAGGQGTRLRFDNPKGMFPVSMFKNKTLFEIFAERARAASKQAKYDLPLAIMTSPYNHQTTLEFFQKNHFFGLNQKQVSFFSQEMLPFLNKEGNMFLESPFRIAVGPDGNASALKHFVDKGIWKKWHELGVMFLEFVQIDNALANLFDPELAGFHYQNQCDVVIKSVARQKPDEKVGIIVKNKKHVEIVEYSEISPQEVSARNSKKQLKHFCANISNFSFGMDFVKKIAECYDQLPFHAAFKSAKVLFSDKKSKMSDLPCAWKFEKFIFDVLPFANKVKVILYPREECFAPLKNSEGADSVEAVREAMLLRDQRKFSELSGIKVDEKRKFELAQEFYYPTDALINKWKGKQLPNENYIRPLA